MNKMWAGMTSGETDKLADDFNSSIAFDCRMFKQDINGSIAHAKMLEKCGIISKKDAQLIVEGLESIGLDLETGKLNIDYSCEDIHMFVEQVLTERIGDAGKRLHTARSRNDQVTLDLRMYLREESFAIAKLTSNLITAITNQAEANSDFIVPGYTHLQRAQPIVFGHHLLAYSMMFLRDLDRIGDALKRINVSPIGSCALAGTTFETDREYESKLLGFDRICQNSIDGVSDRDFCVELAGVISMEMMHLSRLSEELILWTSREFGFVTLDDAYTTGSSIMPQKKNSDMAELVRGKTARVYGDLTGLLTMLKGLPLAYNKDMQEDKEAVFDAIDTVKMCLKIMFSMIATMKTHPENMRKAAAEGFINATDLADYLTVKGEPFRSAYKISGSLVTRCIELGCVLETLPLEEYKKLSPIFESDVYDFIKLERCVEKRISKGGTGPESVKAQIQYVRERLK